MKSFICLLATVYTCNATLLSLFGGNSGGSRAGSSSGSRVTYNVIATPTHEHQYYVHGSNHGGSYGHSYDHGHSHSGSPQVIKVILDQSYGGGGHATTGGYSYGHGYGYSGHSYEGSSHSGGEAQIFKVITQSSGGHAPVHVDHSYSAGNSLDWSSGASYASAYPHGGSHSVHSQLKAILPHILQIILQNDAAHSSGAGGDNLNSHLITHFGQKGKAVITRSNGKSNNMYSGGHVIQKGVLKLMRIEETPATSQPAPVHENSSHGSPADEPHGHTSHSHGW